MLRNCVHWAAAVVLQQVKHLGHTDIPWQSTQNQVPPLLLIQPPVYAYPGKQQMMAQVFESLLPT